MTAYKSGDPTTLNRLYGRAKGKPLRQGQQALVDTLLPRIAVPAEGPVTAQALFGHDCPLHFEIGFGGGEHMAEQARRHPDALILGAEPFMNGVASALRHIEEAGVENVRVHHGDARELMARLPDQCLSRLFIMFPDPWPKARHHKRRLQQSEFLTEAARLLKPGARFRFATDWADYADWALERILRQGGFGWTAERADDWRTPPADHLTTRYETKGLGDCRPVFLDFIRN